MCDDGFKLVPETVEITVAGMKFGLAPVPVTGVVLQRHVQRQTAHGIDRLDAYSDTAAIPAQIDRILAGDGK